MANSLTDLKYAKQTVYEGSQNASQLQRSIIMMKTVILRYSHLQVHHDYPHRLVYLVLGQRMEMKYLSEDIQVLAEAV